MGKTLKAKIWLGREGDGAFVRGGNGFLAGLIRKSGAKYNTELRGWTCTKEQLESFLLVYKGPIEVFKWQDFTLEPFQKPERRPQAVRPSGGKAVRLTKPTTRRGPDGYTRPAGA